MKKMLVELGSGDFGNLRRLAQEYPGWRVVGVEHPELKLGLEAAQRAHNGSFASLREGYEAALQAGAEVIFEDYVTLPLRRKAERVVVIAPEPAGLGGETNRVVLVQTILRLLRPGGSVCVVTENATLACYLALKLNLSEPGRRTVMEAPYPSAFFKGHPWVYVLEGTVKGSSAGPETEWMAGPGQDSLLTGTN